MTERLIKIKEVLDLIGVSRNTLKAIRDRDESFPQPIRLSTQRVAYRESEIAAWIAAR